MKMLVALSCYAAALFLIYMGFTIPGADGLNHHVAPQTDAELAAAFLIAFGCCLKLCGHVALFSKESR